MRLRFFIVTLISLTNLSAQVQIIAHRGASHLAPENTITSVKMAYAFNADAVEIDIHLSADNEVMVHHDKTTKRTSKGLTNFKIAKTTADTLSRIDVGRWKDEKYANEHIPYLRDILQLVPENKKLIIEIKCGTEVIPALTKAIEESGKIKQCDFISFGWKTICEIQAAFPENDCYFITSNRCRIKNKAKRAAEEGLAGININKKNITPKVMRKIQAHELKTLCWIVNNQEDFQQMKALGVTAISTNRPEIFSER